MSWASLASKLVEVVHHVIEGKLMCDSECSKQKKDAWSQLVDGDYVQVVARVKVDATGRVSSTAPMIDVAVEVLAVRVPKVIQVSLHLPASSDFESLREILGKLKKDKSVVLLAGLAVDPTAGGGSQPLTLRADFLRVEGLDFELHGDRTLLP